MEIDRSRDRRPFMRRANVPSFADWASFGEGVWPLRMMTGFGFGFWVRGLAEMGIAKRADFGWEGLVEA